MAIDQQSPQTINRIGKDEIKLGISLFPSYLTVMLIL